VVSFTEPARSRRYRARWGVPILEYVMSKPTTAVRPEPRRIDRLVAIGGLALAGALAVTVLTSSDATAQDWEVQRVESGTKPAIGLTPDGNPVIVYMLERQDGWVRVASLVDDEWQIEEVATGYFYGPPDIAVGPDGVVHAAFHDHQDSSFKPDKGDAIYLQRAAGVWTSTTAADAGHDGWDNRITVDASGHPHMVGIDPVEFGSQDGVEYYSLADDGTWSAEPVGSGPQTYHWAISVAVDPDMVPWVSYHDGGSTSLRLSGRTADGWIVETVDDTGDTGFYSEMAISAEGAQHISYFESLGGSSGIVKHAFRAAPGDEWQISAVDQLDAVFGVTDGFFTGARNITGIDLDADGEPWIVYSDEQVMKLAQLVEGEWQTEIVAQASDLPLGQIVSIEIDAESRPHIAFADVSDKGKLDGSIWYATRS
jgi:hypothetical protein